MNKILLRTSPCIQTETKLRFHVKERDAQGNGVMVLMQRNKEFWLKQHSNI